MDSTTPTTTTTTPPDKPLTRFTLFHALAPELRQQIWTLAFLAPLTPSHSSSSNTPDTALRPLHIRPFVTLPPHPDVVTNLGDVPQQLSMKLCPGLRDDPHADELYRDEKAKRDKEVAQYRSYHLQFLDMPRNGGPAGTPLGMGRHDSGWLVADEAARIAGSCAEARRVLSGMTHRLGAPESWVDLREGLCCFWDQDAAAAAASDDKRQHPVLAPSLTLEDALMLDDGGPAYSWNGKFGMVRGNRGLVAAAAHCEELAVMWSPDCCMNLWPGMELWQPRCAPFRKHLADFVTRHPKLRTLYLLDPMLAPAGLHAPDGSVPKFRGDGASFFEIHLTNTDGWLAPVPLVGTMQVFLWASLLQSQLSAIKKEVEAEGDIQVKVLACVPDLDIRAATKLLEGFLRFGVPEDPSLILAGLVFWAVLIGMAVVVQRE